MFEMAAPIPPGGGDRDLGGGPVPPPPPPPLPLPGPPGSVGPVGPAGPPGPPGPPLTGAALLAQLVAAMQAAVAGLPAPGPGPAPPPPRVKISPLIFSELMTGWILITYYRSTNPLTLSIPSTTWLESGMIC